MTEDREIPRVLVVDDEKGMRDLISDILEADGHQVDTAPDATKALALLEGPPYSVVVSDLRMPGMDGLELLQVIRERHPRVPVIMLTAFGTIPQAVEAIRSGAFDFLEKPVKSPKSLRGIVRRAMGSASRSRTAPPPEDLPPYVCVDPASCKVKELLQRVAPRDTTVLLTGESGTGKEVAAQFIHVMSPRAPGPFVAINAAAMAPNLLEDELFGHEKGAFTGADRSRQGVFEAADGGTLFLDEIGEMSPDLQARLLRVLETQSFSRLGGNRQVDVDVRLLAATNRDLSAAVREGRFRQDLYYRLSVFPVHIPPLRERPADILPLASHFIADLGPEREIELGEEQRRMLQSHSWPGNVRELRNVLERALVLSTGTRLKLPDLAGERPRQPGSEVGTLKEMERRAVIRALEEAGGNRKKAARILGISLRNLQYKVKEYGLKGR